MREEIRPQAVARKNSLHRLLNQNLPRHKLNTSSYCLLLLHSRWCRVQILAENGLSFDARFVLFSSALNANAMIPLKPIQKPQLTKFKHVGILYLILFYKCVRKSILHFMYKIHYILILMCFMNLIKARNLEHIELCASVG